MYYKINKSFGISRKYFRKKNTLKHRKYQFQTKIVKIRYNSKKLKNSVAEKKD